MAPSCFARQGCAGRAPDRALRKHRRPCNLGRIASPVRTNLVFGSDRAAEKIVLWDSWLRGGSPKAIWRAFGKPSSLFIASWPPVLRRPVETTTLSGQKRVSDLAKWAANDPKR